MRCARDEQNIGDDACRNRPGSNVLRGKRNGERLVMSTWLYVLCGLIAILGRILGQALGARKELANRNRQYRLERLVDAWRSVELAASDTDPESRLEGALRDIQLLGTSSQVDRAARVVHAMDGGADPVPLLVDLLEVLRTDLRREMRLGGRVAPLAVAPARHHRARVSLLRAQRRGAAVSRDDVAA
jgi:hypothetical protein